VWNVVLSSSCSGAVYSKGKVDSLVYRISFTCELSVPNHCHVSLIHQFASLLQKVDTLQCDTGVDTFITKAINLLPIVSRPFMVNCPTKDIRRRIEVDKKW
jgi:hypothetical protein